MTGDKTGDDDRTGKEGILRLMRTTWPSAATRFLDRGDSRFPEFLSLCSVCDLFFSAPGEVVEAYYEALGADLDAELEPLERELIRKWREKVTDGRRSVP